jgi:hypothetical protein
MNTGIILRSNSVHPPTTTQMEVKDCHTFQGSDILTYLLLTHAMKVRKHGLLLPMTLLDLHEHDATTKRILYLQQ